MFLTEEQFLTTLNKKVGESSTEEDLKFLEDMTDTYKELSEKSKPDGEDWKAKYEENDSTWRKKYHDRFFSGTSIEDVKKKQEENVKDDSKPRTFAELFKKKEG